MAAISGLADLGHYQHCLRLHLDPPPVPVEFFDDPAHAPDCPLRSPTTEHDEPEARGERHASRRSPPSASWSPP